MLQSAIMKIKDREEPNPGISISSVDFHGRNASMDKDRISGSAKDFAGKLEGTVGNMAGDAQTEAEGRLREAGKAQNFYGQAKDAARDAKDAAIGYAKDTYDNS